MPGTVADDYKLYQQWGVDVRFVQPGLCDWEGSSVILDSGKSQLEMLTEKQKGASAWSPAHCLGSEEAYCKCEERSGCDPR